MREIKPDPVVGEHDSPALEYDRRGDHVTRRQFRLLLILTAINTILLGGVVAGPILVPFVREQWAQYQQRREARLERQRIQAAVEQSRARLRQSLEQLTFDALPAGTVVYTEDPAEIADFIARDAEYVSGDIPRGRGHGRAIGGDVLPAPAYRAVSDEWQQILDELPSFQPELYAHQRTPTGGAYLHLHENPAGKQRLVWVMIETQDVLGGGGGGGGFGGGSPGGRPILHACSIDLESLTVTPNLSPVFSRLQFHRPSPDRKLRIFAGQPHPDDPARFTIDYEMDGRRGTIDGYLRENDTVVLQPREGRILRRFGSEVLWDPLPDLEAAPETGDQVLE